MAIKYLLKQRRTDTLQALLTFLLLISFAACKKEQESQPAPQVPPVSTVHVGGKDYTTRIIGKHTWTTINYDGPGGVPYRPGNEKPEYGRYYTLEEASAIALPAGWRLPTIQDYTALAESQGVVFTKNRATGQEAIKKLTSTANWRTVRGTNASGSMHILLATASGTANLWTAISVNFGLPMAVRLAFRRGPQATRIQSYSMQVIALLIVLTCGL